MNNNSNISNCNLPTGFDDLDCMLTGMHGGNLIVVGGRPGMGKTAFALNIVLYAVLKCQKSVAVFSLEMSKERLLKRMFTANSHNLSIGKTSDKEWTQPVAGTIKAAEDRLIIDDTVSISTSELHSKCREFKLEHGLDMIMVDYLQLMTGSGKSDSRQQEISDISRSLKTLAKELNVPVIALSQMSRQVEERRNHRPMLSDLRECRAIEQDADVIMFIYRDNYYNSDITTCSNTAEIIVAKNANGDIGTVELGFAGGRFI